MSAQRLQQLRILALITGARATADRFPPAAAWFTGRLWFTPWKVVPGVESAQREAQWLAATTRRTWRVDGRTISGFEAGKGPAVLLVHGWGDRAGVLGGFIEPLVAAGYRVVGFDLPAHGGSGRGRTDIPGVADTIAAISAELGGVEAVVAHSLGGAATVVALDRGLDVGRVALLASAVRLENAVGRFADTFRLPASALTALRSHIERRFGAGVWEEFAADRAAAGLSSRALIVHDTDDPQVDVADARLLGEAWPGAQLVTTSGLGHRRILRDPEVISTVVEFVTQPAPAITV